MSFVHVARHRVRMVADSKTGQAMPVADAVPFAFEVLNTGDGTTAAASAAVDLDADAAAAPDLQTRPNLSPLMQVWIITNLGDGKVDNDQPVYGHFSPTVAAHTAGTNAHFALPVGGSCERTVTANGQKVSVVNANITTA